MANLRIIYDNAADRGTITASSTAGVLTVANLSIELKSQVWRSVGTTATLTIDWTVAEIISGIALPFCNLTSTSTIRARGYSDTAGTVLVFDTTAIAAAPYAGLGMWNWGGSALGVNAYSYGGGSYARVWPGPNTAIKKLILDIVDTSNPLGYIEVSRIVAGSYWSPKYNTGYGIPIGYKDTSNSFRNDAGDLITEIGTRAKTMTLDLAYMDYTDRSTMNNITRGNGLPRPMFISVFPSDADTGKEQLYQMYGKLTQLGTISYVNNIQYSSQIDLEEV